MTEIYRNSQAVLTTKHEKELLITKPFRIGLGIEVITPEGIDTDILGTFTGEIPRVGTMRDVLINKARIGMKLTGLPLGIASEGSFGPHPSIPFIASDFEMLIFIDDRLGFSLIEHILTTNTNFSHTEVKKNEYPMEFLQKVGFPKNGLIAKPKTTNNDTLLYKGLKNEIEFRKAIQHCSKISDDGTVHLETDMRAHMNYIRRQTIRGLTFNLIRRLNHCCPSCKIPGWGIVDSEKGLPCKVCGTPTEFIQIEIYGCTKCEYRENRPRSDNKIYAEEKYCSYCNP